MHKAFFTFFFHPFLYKSVLKRAIMYFSATTTHEALKNINYCTKFYYPYEKPGVTLSIVLVSISGNFRPRRTARWDNKSQ